MRVNCILYGKDHLASHAINLDRAHTPTREDTQIHTLERTQARTYTHVQGFRTLLLIRKQHGRLYIGEFEPCCAINLCSYRSK
jgi:hypothetical protein